MALWHFWHRIAVSLEATLLIFGIVASIILKDYRTAQQRAIVSLDLQSMLSSGFVNYLMILATLIAVTHLYLLTKSSHQLFTPKITSNVESSLLLPVLELYDIAQETFFKSITTIVFNEILLDIILNLSFIVSMMHVLLRSKLNIISKKQWLKQITSTILSGHIPCYL